MDPRLKLQYFKEHNWEEKFIKSSKKQVTELWNTTYKVNSTEAEDTSDVEDDLFGHLFKKRKLDKKDELNAYLNEKVLPEKTDILAWWKVFYYYFIITYIYLL